MQDDPFEPYAKSIFELYTFITLSLEGFSYVTVAPEVTDTIRVWFSEDEYEARMEHYQKLKSFSEAQASKGYPYLFSLACVRLWTILEACVDEVLVNLLIDPECVYGSEMIMKLKGPLVEFAYASEEEKAELLKGQLNQELASSLKIGVGRFENPLNALDFGGKVSDPVRRALLELSEVRNVIVHKNGHVDKQFIKRCPWLHKIIGDPIEISMSDYPIYADACLWYIIELADRWKHRYPDSLPDIPDWFDRVEPIQTRIESNIRTIMETRN